MRFLCNTWYLSAWSDELSATSLVARTIIEQPVILFRDAGGAVRALQDRCPHRFAPLSRGHLDDGAIVCG
jgi:phenylpropionate dioxygenase-like ring-hydroxylating dioxygenase large terminal subunit